MVCGMCFLFGFEAYIANLFAAVSSQISFPKKKRHEEEKKIFRHLLSLRGYEISLLDCPVVFWFGREWGATMRAAWSPLLQATATLD